MPAKEIQKSLRLQDLASSMRNISKTSLLVLGKRIAWVDRTVTIDSRILIAFSSESTFAKLSAQHEFGEALEVGNFDRGIVNLNPISK